MISESLKINTTLTYLNLSDNEIEEGKEKENKRRNNIKNKKEQ